MNEATLRFEGQVAVVTGAGNGLGRAYALELAARGASVVCNDVVGSAAQATAEEILQRGGVAVPETSSVASADGGEAIVQAAIDAFGSIEVLVNNAGQLRNSAFDEMPREEFDDVIRTHLGGAFYVSQPAYRYMKTTGYGRVIFTSSSVGLFGYPWSANYAAAKGGLVGLCNVVALEGARYGINANAILPLAIGTSMENAGRPQYSPEDLDEMTQAIKPVARYMTVANVAPLVVYLANRGCNLTGQIFAVGCGRVAQVFVGVCRGWYAPDLTRSTAEEISTHLDMACDRTGFNEPRSATEELRFISENMSR